MWGVFSNANEFFNDIPPREPPLHASPSPTREYEYGLILPDVFDREFAPLHNVENCVSCTMLNHSKSSV